MTIHANSLSAYHGLDLGARQAAVLALYANGAWLSDREAADALGIHPYVVRPRITELIAQGKLVEVGRQRDPVTARTVRICATP